MIKIYSLKDKSEIVKYPVEVINNLISTIALLDKNYGEERDINNDLGGYVVIVENIVDIEMLKQGKLKGLVAEYTDIIECSGNTRRII